MFCYWRVSIGFVLDGRNLSSGEHEGISFIPTADSIKVHEFYA
jgi:hypothetical protein